MRLISTCPSNTEFIGYLGLTSLLVGVDHYSDWPKEIHSLPKVASDLDIDMKRIEELQPDLVLASLSVPGMERNIEKLEKSKIPYVVVPNPKTLTEVGECIRFVGEATGATDRATKLYERFMNVIEAYRTLSRQIEKPKSVYFEWWAKPIFTPGRENWLTEMAELAGGRNIFHDRQEANVITDWDEVQQRNPDVFCIAWVGVETKRANPKVVLRRPDVEKITAIQNNELHILEESLFCRPSPRLIQGLTKLAALLHPDVYPPYDEHVDPLLS